MAATPTIAQVEVNRIAYSGLGNTIVAWIVYVQAMGWVAGHYFEFRIGFYPVWFLECTACLPRAGWLPADWPFVGGISIWVVVALAAAAVLAFGKRNGMEGRWFRAVSGVAFVAMALFTLAALDTRYPGSLPSVFVTVLPGAVAALAYGVAAFSPGSAVVAAQEPTPLTRRSAAAVILGPLSMMFLGGVISVVALYVSATAYARATDSRNRRAAVGGIITGFLSFIMRYNLSGRYGFLGLWF